jgi:hypothetical protein
MTADKSASEITPKSIRLLIIDGLVPITGSPVCAFSRCSFIRHGFLRLVRFEEVLFLSS